MRVSYLHGSADLYGASQMLLHEVWAATTLGHDVCVLLPHEGPLEQRLESLGAEVRVEPSLRVLRRVSPGPAMRRSSVTLPTSDVIVLWTMALLGEARNALGTGARLGVSVHELLLNAPGNALRAYVKHLSVPVQCNSRAVRRWLRAAGIAEDRMHLAYPVVTAHAPVERRSSAPSASSPFTMLLMGRINGTKGHLEATRAVRDLQRSDLRLLLAGSPYPGQERNLDLLMEHVDGVPNVELLGQVDDLGRLAPGVDLLLTLPTRPEPLGLQPIEFWSLGVRSAGWSWGG